MPEQTRSVWLFQRKAMQLEKPSLNSHLQNICKCFDLAETGLSLI